MLFEITGVSTANKGAELMLQAILQHYSKRPDTEFVVARRFGSYSERAQYGLRTKLDDMRSPKLRLLQALLAPRLRTSLGLAAETDIDAVIDASGFAFSDQLGPQRTERFASDVARWKRGGKPVVLLPQSLGPFDTPRLRDAMRRILADADLVFARDRASLEHVHRLFPGAERVRLAPDFTCLVEAVRSDSFEPGPYDACIVPNHRMTRNASTDDGQRYIPFLAACLHELEDHDLRPCVVLHDNRVDESLLAPLEQEYGRPLNVVRESDPRKLKWILGSAQLVIGSRYHALVSALSQGVPTLATGWSHKYEMLLDDYECQDCRLRPGDPVEAIRVGIRRSIEQATRQPLTDGLKRAAARIKQQVASMWAEVDAVLGLSSPEAPSRVQQQERANAREHAVS